LCLKVFFAVPRADGDLSINQPWREAQAESGGG